MYKLKEERDLTPKTTAHLLESMLYARRFAPWFVEPVVAGLQGEDNKPFVYASDLLGAGLVTDDFVVSGTCTENMYGMCESLYKPDMVRPRWRLLVACGACRVVLTATCRVHANVLPQAEDELFEVLAQCLLAAVDRDALSGWGGVVHIM